MPPIKPESFFRNKCEFICSAPSIETLPPNSDLVEVAFLGRSNVGKSSLINAIADHAGLAKTSKTPGRTRQINFFKVNKQFYMVDLPGYGYAKVSKQESKDWNQLIIAYLETRRMLSRVFLLIDARHGPKPNDHDVMRIFSDIGISFQIVLTKIDKIPASELSQLSDSVLTLHKLYPSLHPEILAASGKTKVGIDILREAIIAIVVAPVVV